MESSPTTIAPLLLRNLLTSLFIYADKPLIDLAEKYKLLQFLRCFLVSAFLFFLRLLPSLFPSLVPSGYDSYDYALKPRKGSESYTPATALGGGGGGGALVGGSRESGIARALTQVLSIVNDIPVSSRKYEVVRSLAERLLDENILEDNEALTEVNCKVLSAAFARTLSQLEAAMLDRRRSGGGVTAAAGGEDDAVVVGSPVSDYYKRLSRVWRSIRYYGEVVWRNRRGKDNELGRSSISAEKLAAELLWLAQKMTACGCIEEAVYKWASVPNVAWLALSAEPRLQGSLVKVSAFLFKQARELGKRKNEAESTEEEFRQTNLKLLMSWLPLLCRGSNGTDAPVLTIGERAELERVLEQIIETLEEEEEQEQVLSLWLHHFTYCPSSDWPNLHDCYTRWCSASRRSLLLHQ